MKKHFIHAVVFNNDEFLAADYDTGDWRDLTSADYTVHCLYNLDTEQVIILNDNCHTEIEDWIEAFLEGVTFTGYEVSVNKAVVLVGNDEDTYDEEVFKKYIVNDQYIEVM